MNDMIQKLATFAPALIAQLKGNPVALEEFTKGYQSTLEQQNEQRRRDEMMRIGEEDRLYNRTRQTALDQRAAEDQTWQNTERNLSVAGALGQAGSTAESVPQGEGAIEALFQMLPPETQTAVAPSRDAALRGVAPTVTARQKAELRKWVTSDLMNSRHVKENPDADPDVTAAMPARMLQLAKSMTGQEQFSKNDILQLVEVLEQAPPEKTRIPAAPGSQEEYSDPNTTPERRAQILKDRKEYQTVDDRAPRVTVNTGTNDARVNSRIDRITGAFNSAPIVKEFNEVQAQHQTIRQVVNNAWSGPGDMSVIFAFMKALDPSSVVRETEYANAAQSGNIFSGWAAKFNGKLAPSGGFLSPQVKADFLKTIEARMGVRKAQYDNLRTQTAKKIDRIKAGDPETGNEALIDYGSAFPADEGGGSDAAAAPTGYKVGQKVRNKKTGAMGEVTGVQPDGKPIIKPVSQ